MNEEFEVDPAAETAEEITEEAIVEEATPEPAHCWHAKMENWKCNQCNGIVHSKCPECGWNNWHK